MPGLVKVGLTTRTGYARAADLQREAGTGMPGQYQCIYQRWFSDVVAAERTAHEQLRTWWFSKEWFRTGADQARGVLDALSADAAAAPTPLRSRPPPSSLDEVLLAGELLLSGTDGSLQKGWLRAIATRFFR